MKTTTWTHPCVALAVGALLSLAANRVEASFINGGFETGDFTGWTVELTEGATANVVATYQSLFGTTYNPTEGNRFALIKTDGPGNFEMTYQTISLAAGQTIAGHAAFDNGDILFNDIARVEILDGALVVATPWMAQSTDVAGDWDGPWTAWDWTAAVAGNYTLRVSVQNGGLDAGHDSFVLLDGVAVVPEASTVLSGLLLTLPLGFQALRRLRRA
jgi:hypothetical protein